MNITPAQVAQLAKDHAIDFAEKVDMQFLMEYYIDDYLKVTADSIEDVVDDIFRHNNQDIKATQEFMIESGIAPEDALNMINYIVVTNSKRDY